ncbi:transcriptional regulator GcvA [Hirschia litorea]|uniref:Transcriptional regulator GcvA n=1 Tax=Hirschia litorea TaxID=1199156 RepID=A0ABW2IKZ9_9PROT
MTDSSNSIDRLPPLNALRAFEAAARRLSFTKAAEELNVTPGAISQQIRHLEEFSGGPLFRRTGRQVLLTEVGEATLPLLTNAFEQLLEATHVLRAPKRRNRLMISCAPSFAAKWLAHRLEDFQALHPEAEVWISADNAVIDFAGPEIDLAIRYGGGNYEGLRVEKLMSESVMPVCSPSLLEGKHPLRTPADLQHYTLLHDESPEHDPSCPDWASWLKARNVKNVDAARGLRFNQAAMVVEAAASGRGVALAKRAIAAGDLENGRLIAPFADGTNEINFAYWTVWPRGRTQSPIAREFIKWVKEEAQSEQVVGV